MLENTKLEAVVSMPAGVFQPYAGVKTSFLIFKKRARPITLSSSVIPAKAGIQDEWIWFFDMKGDGSSLSAAKKFGPQYKNDIPKLLELWNKNQAVEKPYSWFTNVADIVENDYILSANTYSPYNGEEEVNHRDPKEILKEITKDESQLAKTLEDISKKI